ncbi:helix-turn-helix domain-containing protein [Dyella psychrodurans]|uniref:AraC family transcriptional regulator n=1 Tax=Dyella psychrodurans TaxID=1927960 RepID=A0A370WWV5_9GAMM|nr:helix-turn-helix domain-containing protein [Dyella psychrodurans]RDS80628.1 AraC family transcriptional regulator [Dyella psychrodurans]
MSTDIGKPRGVLRQRLEHGEFQHARQAPSPALAGLIEHYWHVSWDLRDLPAQQQETLPHPNVQFVVEPGVTGIYGVHTGRFIRVLEGQGRVFGIKFKAGGFFPFYGAPVSELMDRSLEPSRIFDDDATRFESDIFAAPDMDAMSTLAERLLLAHRPPDDANVARVSTLVAHIAADRDLTSVDKLVTQTGLTKRALQRLFHQYVGIGPKWVINRYRIHEAVAQLQAGTPIAWTELALKLGYFDQAHFIGDFRKLVGRSPTEYARAEGQSGT